ncbi:hypothetical protein EYF80_051910 [Liparis tanakae]|uniref:Uncharacterized protein n=1 Tax=Liparis tanakae TaxID=230148 RepID=A0A4Z2FAV1_9TELE|nr:hypothetical protein EYF80_051910 [Liparis tanakae]
METSTIHQADGGREEEWAESQQWVGGVSKIQRVIGSAYSSGRRTFRRRVKIDICLIMHVIQEVFLQS